MAFIRSRPVAVLLMSILLAVLGASAVGAQGIQSSPYSAPTAVRGLAGNGLDLAPSNPLALPGSSAPGAGDSGSVYLSNGMLQGILGPIPNLQVGYLYSFGKNRISAGRLTADYVLPISLGKGSTVFGEAHTEFTDFWKTFRGGFNNRVDMSFGGGFRRMLGDKTLVGVNGFSDSTRLGGTWYSSGGCGFEMAALLSGYDAVDLNFNWYGSLFSRSTILNAFRYGPSNFDFQAGYSHELWDHGPDLRLSATGYKFDVGRPVYGWNVGAELKSRDGMFVLKYQAGRDRLNQTYQTVGAFVNVGFRADNILRGESPFTMPEPIFRSPRNLATWLNRGLSSTRNFFQPASVIVVQQIQQSQQSGHTPVKPYFIFELTDPTNGYIAGDVPFDQLPGVSLTELTWPQADQNATATSYSVAIFDPDGLIPTPTVSVTLTPFLVTLGEINVRPDAGAYNVPLTVAVARDGTPTPVTNAGAVGTPGAVTNGPGTAASGTITIVGAGVQTLVISVHTR